MGSINCDTDKTSVGYFVARESGEFAFFDTCSAFAIVKLDDPKSCSNRDLCPGSRVYYPQTNQVLEGILEASDGKSAYIRSLDDTKTLSRFDVGSLSLTKGCLNKDDLCVGDQIYQPPNAAATIVAYNPKSLELILRENSDSIYYAKASTVYSSRGCSRSGFCVNQKVQITETKQVATVIGINGDRLSVEIDEGFDTGHLTFGLTASDLLRRN